MADDEVNMAVIVEKHLVTPLDDVSFPPSAPLDEVLMVFDLPVFVDLLAPDISDWGSRQTRGSLQER